MKNPALEVYRLYDEHSPRTFREDVEAHLLHGYVFSTPQLFLMGRPVCSWAEPQEINNVWIEFPKERADTWYIYALACAVPTGAVGLVKKTIAHMPYPLPYVAWERKRDRRLRFFRTENFMQNL